MSLFSDALRSAMTTMGWTQDDFVRETKAVSRGSVSRYLAGIDVPKPSTLAEICDHLPPNLVQEVTAAYLTDQIPRSAAAQVSVKVSADGDKEPTLYHPEQPLPGSHLERIIRTLSREATTNTNLFHVLDSLAAAYEGRTPLLAQAPGEVVVRTIEERKQSLAEAERALEEHEQTQKAAKPKKKVRYAGVVKKPS